jgi:hypothetical protein
VLAGEVADEVLHLVVAECIEDAGGHRRCLARDELGVVGSRSHAPAVAAIFVDSSFARTTSPARKFVSMNSPRLRPISSLRFGMIAVCGIGMPRVAEQRRHGEPVGEGTDHAALRRGADVASAGMRFERERDDEQDRHEHERAERDALHDAQRPRRS